MSSTSGVSEMDMSSCSGSPASYMESPHSSPLQQVPQLTTNFTNLSNQKVYSFGSKGKTSLFLQLPRKDCEPYLCITEQPQSHFRFRYETEKSGSTHGCLLAKSYIEKNITEKTFPTVELVNYHNKAIIKCSIKYQNNNENLQEAYKILEDDQDQFSFEVPQKNCYKVGFRGIGIHYKKKTDLATLLYSKRSEQIPKNKLDVKELRAQCNTLSKTMNLNRVRLQFSAYTPEGKQICEPVLSNPIANSKSSSTNALNIIRMNAYSGLARGGEDLFLLVDKIDKKDIEVHFYEENAQGKRTWSAKGTFVQNEVHYQCVIICRTPAYKDPRPLVDVRVLIELYRPSDESTSLPKEFVYKADETYKQIKKRKMSKPWPAYPDTPLAVTGTPLKMVRPNKKPQYKGTQPTQLPNGNIIPQTISRKVIPQSIESTQSEWDNIISQHFDTVIDNTDQCMAGPEQNTTVLQNIPQGAIVQSQETIPKTTQLKGDIELQRALDIYKSLQSKTSESQDLNLQTYAVYETIDLQNTNELQQALDIRGLHVVDESRGIVELRIPNGAQEISHSQELQSPNGAQEISHSQELQNPNGAHETLQSQELQMLEGFDTTELQPQGVEPSPMWGQIQMPYQPQERGAAAPLPLPTDELNTMSLPMEEDSMSQAWFEEYENIFKLLDTSTDPTDKNLSFVSDSGRVKFEMMSSSTQTEDEEIENRDTGSIPNAGNDSNSTRENIDADAEVQDVVKVEGDKEIGAENKVQDSSRTEENVKANENATIKENDFQERITVNIEAKLDEQSQEKVQATPNAGPLETAEESEKATENTDNTEVKETDPKVQAGVVPQSKKISTMNVSIKITEEIFSIPNVILCAMKNNTEDQTIEHGKTKSMQDIESLTNKVEALEITGKEPCLSECVTSDKNTEIKPESSLQIDKDEDTVIEAAESANESVGTRNVETSSEYPVEFSPEDAEEVKKLVQELVEIVRDKRRGATDVMRAKLQRLFDIRCTNGDTFLHMALFKSQRSFEALVKMAHSVKMCHLLEYSNHRGESILHLALAQASPELVALLVDRGCCPMARTAEEDTCVHYAVRYGGAPALRALLDASARRNRALQLDARNAERCTALHLCALHARADCARLLLACGAAADARDALGRTPLHVCALDARPEVARELLRALPTLAGADDARGRSALALLCARRPAAPADAALARLLLAHGARAPPAMARRPDLVPVLKEFVSQEEFEALLAQADDEDESSTDSDSYESADDEIHRGTRESAGKTRRTGDI